MQIEIELTTTLSVRRRAVQEVKVTAVCLDEWPLSHTRRRRPWIALANLLETTWQLHFADRLEHHSPIAALAFRDGRVRRFVPLR